MKIYTTKKQSATEAPKWMTNAWDTLKTTAKDIYSQTIKPSNLKSMSKEFKNALSGQSSDQTKKSLSSTANRGWLGNRYNESDARQWNKEYSLLTDSEKTKYLSNHLPSDIHTEARRELIKTLKGSSLPFTTSLYKLIINHLSRNLSKEAVGVAIRSAQKFNEIFDKETSNGLKLDDDGFQLKAIKYFSDRDTPFKILKDGMRWKSSKDMKIAIDSDKEIEKDLKEGEARTKSKNRQSIEKVKIEALKEFFKQNPENAITKEFSGKSDEDLLEAYDGLKEIIGSRYLRN